MFTQIVTTAEKVSSTKYIPGTNILEANTSSGSLREYQTVVAIGTAVRNIAVGDIVCIDPSRYAERKYAKDDLKSGMDEYYNGVTRYHFNIVQLDGVDHLLIQESDISFIVEDYEEYEEAVPLVAEETVNKEVGRAVFNVIK